MVIVMWTFPGTQKSTSSTSVACAISSLNFGPIRDEGVEMFVEHRFGDGVTGFLNYSWQAIPRPLPAAVPFPRVEIGLQPRLRVNAGLYWSGSGFVGSLTMNYADEAFWVDVLPHDFDGYSPSYTCSTPASA